MSLEPQELWSLLSIPSRRQSGDAQPITEPLSLSSSLLSLLLTLALLIEKPRDQARVLIGEGELKGTPFCLETERLDLPSPSGWGNSCQ